MVEHRAPDHAAADHHHPRMALHRRSPSARRGSLASAGGATCSGGVTGWPDCDGDTGANPLQHSRIAPVEHILVQVIRRRNKREVTASDAKGGTAEHRTELKSLM